MIPTLSLFDHSHPNELFTHDSLLSQEGIFNALNSILLSREVLSKYTYKIYKGFPIEGKKPASIEQKPSCPIVFIASSSLDISFLEPTKEERLLTFEEAIYLNIKHNITLISPQAFWPEHLTAASIFSVALPLVLDTFKDPGFNFDSLSTFTSTSLGPFIVILTLASVLYPLIYKAMPGFEPKLGGFVPGFAKVDSIGWRALIMEGFKLAIGIVSALCGLTFGLELAKNFAPMLDIFISSLITAGVSKFCSTLLTTWMDFRGSNWHSFGIAFLSGVQTLLGYVSFVGMVDIFQLLQGVFTKYLTFIAPAQMVTIPLNFIYILLYALTAGQLSHKADRLLMNHVVKKEKDASLLTITELRGVRNL